MSLKGTQTVIDIADGFKAAVEMLSVSIASLTA